MRKLILLRGVPGSGKTTMAMFIKSLQNISIRIHAFAADDFFMRGGVYRFDPKQLKDAHQ